MLSQSAPKVIGTIKSNRGIGDGVTDDTIAINAAITAGNPCNQGCVSVSGLSWLKKLLLTTVFRPRPPRLQPLSTSPPEPTLSLGPSSQHTLHN